MTALPHPKATLVGFSTPKRFNPLSWLVRKLTGSTVSHAWLLYRDHDFDLEMVMEAHEFGFRLLPYDTFQRHNVVVEVVNPDVNLDIGLRMLARRLGSAYDYGGLIGMVVVLLGRWLKRKWRNPLASSHAMFCSEAVVLALQASDCERAKTLVASTTSPQALMEALVYQ